jgi:uncharacterized FlaG/YvyC family protein
MSEPINSVDFTRIEFPDGRGAGDLSGGAREYAENKMDSVVTRSAARSGRRSESEYVGAVQSRFNEAGANVRVGVETVNGSAVFTIRDSETGQVIRKIPSDEAIRIANNLDNLTGLYVDRIE